MTLSELQKAGFTTEEIGRYAREKRQKLLEAGFTPDEINSNFYGSESVETLAVEQPAGKPPWWDRLIMAGAPEPPPASIDQVMTALMPDKFKNDPATYSEEVAKSMNPLVRPFVAQGFNAMSALNRGFAAMVTHLDSISTYLAEKTGAEKAGILGPDALKKVADYYNKDADHWAKRAGEVGISFIDELVSEAMGGAMPGIAEFMLNVPYFTLLGAAEAYRKGENELAGAFVEGAKRGVLGAMFHSLAPLKKYLQAPLMGGVFGVQAAVEGATPREIAKSVGTGALYALTSPGGRLGLNDLKKDLVKHYVRTEAEKPPKVDLIAGLEPTLEDLHPGLQPRDLNLERLYGSRGAEWISRVREMSPEERQDFWRNIKPRSEIEKERLTEPEQYYQLAVKGIPKAEELGAPPDLILTGGPTGAGKSFFAAEINKARAIAVEVNSDIVKEHMGVVNDPSYHEVSSDIARYIYNKAKSEGYNILYDSTLANYGFAKKAIDDHLAAGGKASVLFTTVEPETSIVRAKLREETTGRKVPESAILNSYNRALPTFLKLLEDYRDDPRVGFKLVDNDVDGARPKEVFTKKINQEIEIQDQKLFDKYISTPYNIVEGTGKEVRYERTTKADQPYLDTKRGEILRRTLLGRLDRSRKELQAAGIQEPGVKTPAVETAREGIVPPRPASEPDITPQEKPIDTSLDRGRFPVVRVPLAQIQARPDVFQFKLDVTEEGVQKPLKGEWNELAGGNLLLWQDKGGNYFVANGHHRLALAKGLGVKNVNAQILKESEGYSTQDARRIAAEANILGGKGTIFDHAEYFRTNPEYTQDLSTKRGLTGAGYLIGRQATENTYSQFRARKISPDAAEAISTAAPNNDTLQIAGVKFVIDHPKADTYEVENFINALAVSGETPVMRQDNLFGFNDQAIRDAETQAKAVSVTIRGIRDQINAVRGAAKRPEVAAKMGVDVKDPEGVRNKVGELNQSLTMWEKWFNFPELVAQIREQTNTVRPGQAIAMNVRERDALGLTENQARLLEKIQGEDPQRYATIMKDFTEAQRTNWEAVRKALSEEPESVSIERMTRKTGAGEIPTKETPMPVGGKDFTDQQILERFENEFRTDPGHLLVTEKNISKIKEIAAILKEKIDKSIIRPDEYFALRGSYFIPRKKFRKSSESVDDIRIGSLSGTSAVELSPNATVGEIETAIKHATAYGDKIFLLKASGEPLRGNDFWADEIILPEHQIEGIHFNLKDVVKEFDLIRKYYKAELAAKAYPKTKDPHFTLDYYSITSEKNAPVIYKFKDGSEIPIPEDVFNDLGKEKAREQILLMQIRKAIAENKQIPDELLLWADLPKPSPPSTEGGGISIPPTKATLPMAREGEEWRRAPEGEKAGPPMSRADILRFLQEKLEIPIRTGRFIERALAVFKPSERVIRSQKFADIEAIAHEVGHSIQEFLWPETVQGLTPTEKLDKYQAPPLTRDKPFLPFRDELIDLASMARPGQSRLAEGYAEFVRLYMTNEPMASGLAPKFYEYFDHLLEQRAPESREVFFQVREMYNQYMRQPAYQRVRSQVSIGENIPRKTTLDDLYTLALDEFHPLKRTQKEILQGEKIPLGDRPYERARLLNGWMGKANSFLRHAAFRFNTLEDIGKSFQDILKPIAAENNLEELSTYLVAKRVPGLADRGIDVGIGVEDAKKVVADLDVKYSKVFADLEIYQENLLKYLVESGILSDDAYKKISTVSKDYDPFYRVFEERTGPGGGMGKGLQAYQPIKEIKGGWQRIQDPLESIIKNTMLYINLSERNAVGKSLVTLAQSHEGMGKFVEEIPVPMYGLEVGAKEIFSPQEAEQLKKAGLEPQEFYTIFRPNAFTPRENVISVWIAGERKDYQVEPDVYRTFRALDREGANALERLAAYPARWLRAGSVLTPEFLARNPFRDQFSAFIQSKYNFIPGLDLIRGVFHLMKQDETYWKWQKSGGTQATLASMDRDYFQEKMGEILKGYPILKLIKNPIEGLRVLGELGEIGTRLGEFAKGLKAEGETKGGIEAAGFSSREVTTDFQRFGAKTRGVNLIIAFWNANMQAMDRTVRAFQENPAAATIKAMAAITLPSVLLAWANHDDPRYWEIPQWQRDLCWIVFPNHMSKESWEAMSDEEKSAEVRLVTGAAWRFPKPWEIGILFGSIPERITHYILKNDPEAFSKIGESIFRTIIPPILPNIAIPWIENLTNYSFFFDRNIVPGDRKDLPPEFQYGPWTTPAAKALGETLGRLPYIDKTQFASPAKVENLIRGWTGGLGYYALQIASAGLQYTGAIEEGPPKPTKSFADIPLIKAFAVRYPSTSAESIQEFYERYKEAAGIARAIEVTAREYRFDKSIKLLVEDYAGNLEGHHQTMSNLQKMVELVYNNPDMTPDEKREFVDICYFQMIDVAHNGVQMIKELKKILKENRKEPQRPAEPIKPRKPAPLKTPRSVEFEGR